MKRTLIFWFLLTMSLCQISEALSDYPDEPERAEPEPYRTREARSRERRAHYGERGDSNNSRPRKDKDGDIERLVDKMRHRRNMLKRRLEEVDVMFKNHESGEHVMDADTKTHMERQHNRLLQQINDLDYVDDYKNPKYRRLLEAELNHSRQRERNNENHRNRRRSEL